MTAVATPPPSTTSQELAAATARANAAEQRNAILEVKSQLDDRGLDQMQVDLAAFAVLMTIMVIFFSLRATNEAKSEARNVARDEIKATRDELKELHDSVEAAKTLAQKRAAEVAVLIDRVKDGEAKAQASLGNILAHEGRAKEAVALVKRESIVGTEPGKKELTPTVAAALAAADEEAKDTAQNQWTVDQYKSAILNALFGDDDPNRAAKLARDMEARFSENDDAVIFAQYHRGYAERVRCNWSDSLEAFEKAIGRLTANKREPDAEYTAIFYNRAFVLNEIGRHVEAEEVLRILLPQRENLNGPESIESRVTRLLLARAILDQERAGEAEVIFRLLLPLCEKIDGPDAAITLVTRQCFAEALLELDEVEEAAAVLAKMPDQIANREWLARHAARLAFVRAKLADRQARRAAATVHLGEASQLCAANFPEDHALRRQVEEYIAQRGGLD